MARKSNRRIASANQPVIPVYGIDCDTVDQAFEAFAALRRAAQLEPGLIENPYFTALQDTAYARFMLTFEAL